MRYYIGVDGGGTKTAIVAANCDASVFYHAKIGSTSWREHGIETVVKDIKQAIETLPFQAEGSIAGMALGLPCHGESDDGDHKLLQALHTAFDGIPLYLCNDVEVGWAGSLALSPGVNVVAGTGAIAFGKDEGGNSARCGGWSDFFSDEGSCYWIGLRVMGLFAKQSDGRVARDALYEIVRRELKLTNDMDLVDLIHGQYMQRDKVAALQLLAKQAASAGSKSARELYMAAAAELCLLVRAIRDRLAFAKIPFVVSYSGGLFHSADFVLPGFIRGIEDMGGKLMPPRFEPAEGALLLAFSHFHVEGLPRLCARLDEKK